MVKLCKFGLCLYKSLLSLVHVLFFLFAVVKSTVLVRTVVDCTLHRFEVEGMIHVLDQVETARRIALILSMIVL